MLLHHDDEQATATDLPPVGKGAIPPVVDAAPAEPQRRRRWPIVVGVLCAIVIVAGVGVGAFFAGQDTRKSDRVVDELTRRAVAAETAKQEDIRRTALNERKAKDRKTLQRVVRKMKRSAAARAQQSYASGQSVGYSSGHASGKEEGHEEGYDEGSADGYDEGLTEGSDDLTCSDDPDVDWLPACP